MYMYVCHVTCIKKKLHRIDRKIVLPDRILHRIQIAGIRHQSSLVLQNKYTRRHSLAKVICFVNNQVIMDNRLDRLSKTCCAKMAINVLSATSF